MQLVGADHVAIGTDVAAHLAAPRARRGELPRSRERFEGMWPARDQARYAQWKNAHQYQSLAWTNWPLFTVGMVMRGYKDDAIQKILGSNILRVARETLA